MDNLATVRVDRAGDVVTVRLHRPDKRNALDDGLLRDLRRVIEALRGDGSVRAVVLCGDGVAFCTGGDLVDHPVFTIDDPAERRPHLDGAYAITAGLRELPVPVIAAIHGYCLGAGMSLAAACDVRIASADATFGLDFVRMGVLPDMGGTTLLPPIIGTANTLALALTAHRIDADRAREIGFVQQVVAEASALDAAQAMAVTIAGMPSEAVRAIKRATYTLPALPLDEGLAREADELDRLLASDDSRAAVAAFGARRKTG